MPRPTPQYEILVPSCRDNDRKTAPRRPRSAADGHDVTVPPRAPRTVYTQACPRERCFRNRVANPRTDRVPQAAPGTLPRAPALGHCAAGGAPPDGRNPNWSPAASGGGWRGAPRPEPPRGVGRAALPRGRAHSTGERARLWRRHAPGAMPGPTNRRRNKTSPADSRPARADALPPGRLARRLFQIGDARHLDARLLRQPKPPRPAR